MGLMEVDEIAVETDVWEAAKDGDKDAKKAIREQVEELEIYFHNLSVWPDYWNTHTVITLKELQEVCGPIYVFIKTSNRQIEWAQNYVSSGQWRKDLKEA